MKLFYHSAVKTAIVIQNISVMNRTIINKIKTNKTLYSLYYYIGSNCVKFLGLFTSINKKRIIFSSFGGRKYDDSPKCIYETMRKDSRFEGFEFVWCFNNPSKHHVNGCKIIRCDTFGYYKMLMSSGVWVTNSTMERGLSFKPKSIFNINTWHGSAIKLIGSDVPSGSKSFISKGSENHDDIMLAQSMFDVEVFSKAFGIPKEKFRTVGLPRNDELTNCNTEEYRRSIRKQLGITEGKKVILYAPTYREYDRDPYSNCILMPPINLKKLEEKLGTDYVILMRAHYEVVKTMKIDENNFIKNVSSHPNLNELMIVSDILVSDYSSIFFDYSIQDKPMLCFAYDYDKYASVRGMYFDIREKLGGNSENEDELISAIKNLNEEKAIKITQAFRQEFVEAYGSASKLTVDIIWKYLNGETY